MHTPPLLILTGIMQVVIAVSVYYVWGLNFADMKAHWAEYRLPDWLRVTTCLGKLTAGVLLILGAIERDYAVPAASLMGLLMTCAFAIHLQTKSPWRETAPSLILLTLCVSVIGLMQLV